MTDTQVTLFQIDNYGPWTTTPEPRREPDLQALQADLYADLARFVGSHDGYVFPTRFDNVVAVTNGMDREAHERLQTSIANRYPVTLSFSAATGESPADALATATDALQTAGSAQAAGRVEAARWNADPVGDARAVQIAHFDVVDATTELTDRLDAFDSHYRVTRAYLALADRLREEAGLAFFVGGDNVIAATPELDRASYDAVLADVAADCGVTFQVGVGTGPTAVAAGSDAKHALEECRRDGVRVAGVRAPTATTEG